MTTLYTSSSVDKLIADYLEAGGQLLQIEEGTLGHGYALLYDAAGKLRFFVIKEVYINEWSSGHKVRGYNKSRRNTRKSLKTWWDKFTDGVSKYAFPSVILVGSQKT